MKEETKFTAEIQLLSTLKEKKIINHTNTFKKS